MKKKTIKKINKNQELARDTFLRWADPKRKNKFRLYMSDKIFVAERLSTSEIGITDSTGVITYTTKKLKEPTHVRSTSKESGTKINDPFTCKLCKGKLIRMRGGPAGLICITKGCKNNYL